MSARALSFAVSVLLVLAVLGDGGASAGGLLLTHGSVVALLLLVILWPGPGLEPRAPAAAPAAAFGVFALLALAGALAAPYRYAAFLVLQEVAAFGAVACLAARCGPRLSTTLRGPLVAAAAIEGIVALAQRFSGELRPAGTFLNPNHLAAWLVAALLLGASAAADARKRSHAWLLACGALPAGLALALGGSRGALLALAAGAAVLLACFWSRLGGRARFAAAAIAAVLVIAVAAGVAVRFGRGDAFRYHRLKIWGASLRAVAASPWTGTGPGQFPAAAANLNFPISEGPLRFARSVRATDSDLVRLPVEYGLPAAIALLAALALSAAEIARRRRAGALPAGTAGSLAALAALAVQASVDNLSQRPALHLLAAALLGSLLSTERVRGTTRPRLALRAAAAVALAALFAIGDVAPYLAWRAALGLPRGLLGAAGRERLGAAIAWNPMQPDFRLRRAEDLASGEAFGLPVYARAREAAEQAVRLQPADAFYRMGIARVEALGCTSLFRDEASRARAAARYDEAIERARHDPFPLIEKGNLLLRAGDPAGAHRSAEQALRVEPEAVLPRLLLAEAILAEGAPGSRERAGRILEEAEAKARRWAGWPRESPYEAHLLALDPARARALRERLERR